MEQVGIENVNLTYRDMNIQEFLTHGDYSYDYTNKKPLKDYDQVSNHMDSTLNNGTTNGG